MSLSWFCSFSIVWKTCSHLDLNQGYRIQSPRCWPLHYGSRCIGTFTSFPSKEEIENDVVRHASLASFFVTIWGLCVSCVIFCASFNVVHKEEIARERLITSKSVVYGKNALTKRYDHFCWQLRCFRDVFVVILFFFNRMENVLPPGFEPGLSDSESEVLTATLWEPLHWHVHIIPLQRRNRKRRCAATIWGLCVSCVIFCASFNVVHRTGKADYIKECMGRMP